MSPNPIGPVARYRFEDFYTAILRRDTFPECLRPLSDSAHLRESSTGRSESLKTPAKDRGHP
jgi:hypothetical protein